jgi:serine/threonine protein phosphatase 1
MMLAALNNEPRMMDQWLMNGGSWVQEEMPYEVRDTAEAALERMPYAIEVAVGDKRIGIVHAEVTANDWSRFESGMYCPETSVWGRSKISQLNPSRISGIDAVVCGHTIVTEPVTLGNQHYIDTGAFHTGRLTLHELSEVIA